MFQASFPKNECSKALLLLTAFSLILPQVDIIYNFCIGHICVTVWFVIYILIHHFFDVNELIGLDRFFAGSVLFVAFMVLPFLTSVLPLCLLMVTSKYKYTKIQVNA